MNESTTIVQNDDGASIKNWITAQREKDKM
jgi:hypothetical protein